MWFVIHRLSVLVVLATDWHRTETSKCMMIYSGYLAVESIWTMFHPYLTTVKWSWHARHHLQQSWEIFRCDSISNLHNTGDRYEYDYFPPFWILMKIFTSYNWASSDISMQYPQPPWAWSVNDDENHLKFTVGIYPVMVQTLEQQLFQYSRRGVAGEPHLHQPLSWGLPGFRYSQGQPRG